MIQSGMTGDGEKPVDDRPAPVEAVEITVGFDEGLLHQVLCVLPMARHLEKEIENARGMEPDNLFKPTDIAVHRPVCDYPLAAGSRQQLGVVGGGGGLPIE